MGQARMACGKRSLLIGLLTLALVSFPALAQGLESFSLSLSFDSAGRREGAIEVGLSLGRFGLSSRTAFDPGGFFLESISFNLEDGQLDFGLAGDFTLAGFTTGRIAVGLGRGLEGSAEFALAGLKSGQLAFNFGLGKGSPKLKIQGELAFDPTGLTELEAEARYRLRLSGPGLELVSTTAFDLQGFTAEELELGLPIGPLELVGLATFAPHGLVEERLTVVFGWEGLTLNATTAFAPAEFVAETVEIELHGLPPGLYLNGSVSLEPQGLAEALLITDFVTDRLGLSANGAWERSGLSSGELSLWGIVEQAELELGGTLLFGPEGLDSAELAAAFPLGTVYLSSATTIERDGLWEEELIARALLQPWASNRPGLPEEQP